MPSNPETQYHSRGKRIYFSLAMYLQTQKISRIRGDDPLDMVSLILKEGCSKTKFRILQTKTRLNHFLMLLTKFLKILENIAFAFITSHNRLLTIYLSSNIAVYFSKKMDLEQSVKNIQAQNNQFQKII